MKTIALLGSTGSIGQQTLEVCNLHNIKVKFLAARHNYKLLAQQAKKFNVSAVCIYDDEFYIPLKELLSGSNIDILCGMDGMCEICSDSEVNLVVNAVVGMVGLLPTLTAINNKKDIALANKETLVAGGEIVMSAAKVNNVNIYPVDSEHSAIFQCLQGSKRDYLNKIILTASGGPFFEYSYEELKNVTVEAALKHPNWSMGNKITIDSATLMNKGLEFIEAKWLFDLDCSQIEIVVHRESVIHSAVEYKDYSVIAQLGVPDMKIPIQYSLLYPERTNCDVKRLSLTDYGTLSFFKPDYKTFECLASCIKAIEKGGSYPCFANGVNEEAVNLFLNGRISFLDIGKLVSTAVDSLLPIKITSYDDVVKADTIAREFVKSKYKLN